MKAKINGQKIELTPLLMIKESKTIGERIGNRVPIFVVILVTWVVISIFLEHGVFVLTIAWIIVLIGLPLIFFLFPGKHKFSLCKEGVFIKSGIRSWLYRWDSFRYFTTDNSKKRFKLKLSIGSISLTSREHFDEVRQILSEHITPKQKK